MVELSSPVLVLGVGGAGKSLLLRRLHALAKTGRVEPHVDADVVPSVGVDIVNLAIDKSRSLQLKEVGGAMMPLWPMYLKLQTGSGFAPGCALTSWHCGLMSRPVYASAH